jgi:hypothetical protein
MAKLIPYDVTGVETRAGGTGVKVKPGVRVAKIEICEQRDKKNDGSAANDIRVALNFGSEYDWGFTYIGLSEASDWKLAEFVRAVGMKEKGRLDPEKQIGKFIRVKVNSDTYEGEYSPSMGRLMPPQPGDEEAWESGNGSASELSNNGAEDEGPDDEGEPEGEAEGFYREGQPDPDDPNEVVGSYDDWPDEDLAAEAEDRELTVPGGRGSKRTKLITALRDDDAAAGEEGGNGEEGEAESGEEDDYESWDLDQLKTEWAERELGELPKVRGRNAETRLKGQLIEGLREDDETNPFEA